MTFSTKRSRSAWKKSVASTDLGAASISTQNGRLASEPHEVHEYGLLRVVLPALDDAGAVDDLALPVSVDARPLGWTVATPGGSVRMAA